MSRKHILLTLLALLALSLLVTACGGDEVVEKVVTVEVEKVVTVEVEKEVEKIVTVEVAAEVEEAVEEAPAEEAAAEPTEAPAEEAAAPAAQECSTLQIVQERGILKCGGNANVPGFGYLDADSGGSPDP